jgi:hypothetical protein
MGLAPRIFAQSDTSTTLYVGDQDGFALFSPQPPTWNLNYGAQSPCFAWADGSLLVQYWDSTGNQLLAAGFDPLSGTWSPVSVDAGLAFSGFAVTGGATAPSGNAYLVSTSGFPTQVFNYAAGAIAPFASPVPGAGYRFVAISGFGDNDIWLAAVNLGYAVPIQVFHYDGLAWADVSAALLTVAPVPILSQQVCFWAGASDLYLAGYDGNFELDSSLKAWCFRENGGTWSLLGGVELPPPAGISLMPGQVWRLQTASMSGYGTRIWIVGTASVFSGVTDATYTAVWTWDGIGWSCVALPEVLNLPSIAGLDSSHVFIQTLDLSGGSMWLSSDGGASFSKMPWPDSSFLWSMALGAAFGAAPIPPVPAPFFVERIPVPGATDVDEDFTTVRITVLQETGRLIAIDAYEDGIDAYRAHTGYNLPEFSGTYSHFTFPDPPYDGYDAISLEFLRPAPYAFGSTVSLHVVATNDGGQVLDGTWAFDVEPPSPPFLRNQSPVPGQTGVDQSAPMSADILDIEQVDPSTIDAYVDGVPAYHGGAFLVPFNGSVLPVIVEGYGGFHMEVLQPAPFAPNSLVDVRLAARNIDGLKTDQSWQFRTAKLLEVAVGPYEITLDVDFGQPMLAATMFDAARFSLSGGAYARAVDPLLTGGVLTGARLWVEGFRGAHPFTLDVSPAVLDSSGDPLPPSSRTATILPFPSSAYYSNTTGLVRSWHESRAILRDSKRVYLSGTRGLDILDVGRGVTLPFRWAQILDANGVQAACLAGTADYDFSHSGPPLLSNRHPAPGETGVSQSSIIYLSVVDFDTAPDLRSLSVYVNGALVFGGSAGWAGGRFGGQVRVLHQVLAVQLYPYLPLPPGTNTVEVLANDLFGNLMDASYSFSVGAPPPPGGGFGDGPFGIAPFGL